VWPTRFARQHGPLRPVVERVLRGFLTCGVVSHGFARLWCPTCRTSVLCPFSCRGRSFCPSRAPPCPPRRATRDLGRSRAQARRLAAPGLLFARRRGDPLRGREGHRGPGRLPRRAPLSLQKLVYLDGQQAVLYRSRLNRSLGRNFEAMHPLQWLGRLADHIPDPGRHHTHFYAGGRGTRRSSSSSRGTWRSCCGSGPSASRGSAGRCGRSWSGCCGSSCASSSAGEHPHLHLLTTDGGKTAVPGGLCRNGTLYC